MNEEPQFAVVTNEQLQHSIWPTDQKLPAGWTREGFTGSRSSCLSHIKRDWKDIRPKAVRTPHPFGPPQTTDVSWLPSWCPVPNVNQESVVFCFPYAGGAAHSYRAWSLKSKLRLLPLAYPGRGERSDEPSITSMGTLAETIATFVTNYSEHYGLKSFGFFGHSMGALVAFATSLALQRSGRKTPSILVASAAPAPHLPIVDPLAELDDEKLLAAIYELQDPQVRNQSRHQLHSAFLPMLRNDLTICERFHPTMDEPIRCPILAVAADEDPRVDEARVEKWADLTTMRFDIQSVPGAHFYFERDYSSINRVLEDAMASSLGQAR